jgi:hypothetical protein
VFGLTGNRLASSQDVIVVTVTYRLNLFGFAVPPFRYFVFVEIRAVLICAPQVLPEIVSSGDALNVGLSDQQAAL